MRGRMIALFTIGIILLFLASCSSPRHPVNNAPDIINPVAARMDSAFVTRGAVKTVEHLPGITRTDSVAVRLESVGGRFGEFYVFPGDTVTAGQLLARLDTDNLGKQIERKEYEINRMRQLNFFDNRERLLEIAALQLNYAEANRAAAENPGLNSIENINKISGNIERAVLAVSHAQERQALDLRDAETRLSRLRDEAANAEITAPVDGTVIFLAVSHGERVNNRDVILYIKPHNQRVFVEYIGQEMNLSHARWGAGAQGRIGESVDATEQIFDLAFIQPTLEEQLYYNRRGIAPPIRYEILGDETALPPAGEFMSIFFYTHWHEDTLRIPRNALFIGGADGNYVYRIENGTHIYTPVTSAVPTETYVAIFSGLEEGDEVFVRP